ncbi:MAG: serine/threonine protein kinase [Planctomycetes bacterium]|nr:serine/threonine protein kinase [Planctomycetota bacterium]
MAQIKNVLFGKLAVSTRFITEEQLQECLDFQKEIEERGEKPPRLGEILEQKGYLTKQQIQSILETMSSMQRRRFGEIGVAFHFITLEQLETCLDIQKLLQAPQETVPLFGQALVAYRNFLKQVLAGGPHPRIGDVLCSMGYMRPHQVEAILEEQNKRIVRCKSCEASLNISRFQIGQKIKCGQCSAVLEIVKPEGAEDLDVALPPEEAPPAGEEGAAAEGGGEGDEDQPLDPATALMEVEKELAARRATQELAAQKKSPGRIADFQVITRLGQDATGVIFKANQISKSRPVALKIMNPSVMNDKSFQKRFVDEAKKVAGLDHPNIKKIYALGKADARFYIAMEFVEAESVYNILEKQGKFHFETALNIAISLVEALQYAQGQGMIHGDIRPSNILILKDGTVKLANLGLATKITENILAISRSGQMAPFYIAPECVTGDREMDHRTDVYSLGATLFHMVAGRPPFQGQSPFEVLVRLTEETIPPLKFFDPSIPDSVCRIVEKMLEAEPQDRYQTYEELLADLRAVQMTPAGAAAGGAPVPGGTPAAAKPKTAIQTADEARKMYESRAAHAIRMRSFRRAAVVFIVLGGLIVGGFAVSNHLKEQERSSEFSDLKGRFMRASSPDGYIQCRGVFRTFADKYPGTPEAAEAESAIRNLSQMEESDTESERAALLKTADERMAEFRFKEALERLTTGSFVSRTDPQIAAKAVRIEEAAKVHWVGVEKHVVELAEEGKFTFASDELELAVRIRELPDDAGKAQALRDQVAGIKKRKDDEVAAAKTAQVEAESLQRWKTEEDLLRKMILKMEFTEAIQKLVAVKPNLVQKHLTLVADVEKQLLWLQELKMAAIMDVKMTAASHTGNPQNDRRIRVKLNGGIEYRAAGADEGGIHFLDAAKSEVEEVIPWPQLDSQTLYAALSKVLTKNNFARFHFGIGLLCVMRAEAADASMKNWLMLRAEERLREAIDGGLANEAAPIRRQVEDYFENTKQEMMGRARTAIQGRRFDEAKVILRNLVNQFATRIAGHAKDIDQLWADAFAGGEPGAACFDFTAGVPAGLQVSSGWKAAGGILKGSGRQEEIALPGAAPQAVAMILRFDRKDFRFAVDLGGAELRIEPETGKYDLYIKDADGKIADREQLKEKVGDLPAREWHIVELRRVGNNGEASMEILVDGVVVTAKAVLLKAPLTQARLVLKGKSDPVAGAIDLDLVTIRSK